MDTGPSFSYNIFFHGPWVHTPSSDPHTYLPTHEQASAVKVLVVGGFFFFFTSVTKEADGPE